MRTRPMAQAARIALFEREVRERLSRAALDLIMRHAEVLSEGQRTARARKPVYVGSTMVTIELSRVAPLLREPCDAATARKLAVELGRDAAATARLRALATREAARVSGAKPRSTAVEIKVSSRGARVLVDLDVEAAL